MHTIPDHNPANPCATISEHKKTTKKPLAMLPFANVLVCLTSETHENGSENVNRDSDQEK